MCRISWWKKKYTKGACNTTEKKLNKNTKWTSHKPLRHLEVAKKISQELNTQITDFPKWLFPEQNQRISLGLCWTVILTAKRKKTNRIKHK